MENSKEKMWQNGRKLKSSLHAVFLEKIWANWQHSGSKQCKLQWERPAQSQDLATGSPVSRQLQMLRLNWKNLIQVCIPIPQRVHLWRAANFACPAKEHVMVRKTHANLLAAHTSKLDTCECIEKITEGNQCQWKSQASTQIDPHVIKHLYTLRRRKKKCHYNSDIYCNYCIVHHHYQWTILACMH